MTPNVFDQAARYAAKLDPLAFLLWLLPRLAAAARFVGWLDTRTVPYPGDPDRTCDTVAGLAEVTDPPRRWALPIEFQSRPDAALFGRLLEYLARLWLELRPPELPDGRYEVGAAVVNLTGVGRTSREMRLGRTGVRTCLAVVERNLAEEDAAATLAGIEAGRLGRGLLPWIPLLHGGAEAGIIAQWKDLAAAEPDMRRRADYGGLALVFAELAGCWLAWKRALEGWNVEVSQQVLEWQAQARQEGEREGELRGRREGERKGKREGERKGKRDGKREALLDLLALRFPPAVPPDVVAAVRATNDLKQLDRWFAAAATAASLDEVRHLLPNGADR
jgi:hypothetical protein